MAAPLGYGQLSETNADAGVDFFEQKIRPLFVEHCLDLLKVQLLQQ